MQLVVEGRTKRTRNMKRRYQAAQLAMKVLSAGVGAAGAAFGPFGAAASAVVSAASAIVDLVADSKMQKAETKKTVLDMLVNMLSGVLKVPGEDWNSGKKQQSGQDQSSSAQPEQNTADFEKPQKDYVEGNCTKEVTDILDLLR